MKRGEILGQAAAYYESLMRAFALKGDLPDVLDAQTQVGITLADLTLPEYFYGVRGKHVRYTVTQPALAANISGAWLGLATGFDQILCVDELRIWTGTAQDVLIALQTLAFTAGNQSNNGMVVDDRYSVGAFAGAGGFGSATVFAGNRAGPVVIGGCERVRCQLNTMLILKGPYIITGGGGNPGLAVQGTTVNTDLTVTYVVRERTGIKTEFNPSKST
jgi:hypothetical protein